MAIQILLPRFGILHETETAQMLLPGFGIVHETVAAPAGGFVPYPNPRYALTGGMQSMAGGT